MRVQRVTAPGGGPESWTVVDDSFAVVAPVDDFLAYLTVIERSPGTVRSYAFDLRDYFEFLSAHGTDWRTVRLEHLGRFVGWLRLTPAARSATVTSLAIDEPHCSAVTINRKLSAVGSFYTYHHRHGVDCGELLTTIKSGGATGSWRPFLAHLGSQGNKRRRTIKLKTSQRIPRTLSPDSVFTFFVAGAFHAAPHSTCLNDMTTTRCCLSPSLRYTACSPVIVTVTNTVARARVLTLRNASEGRCGAGRTTLAEPKAVLNPCPGRALEPRDP